jgi:hypothetical protein
MKLQNVKKINGLSAEQIKMYKSQKNVTRQREVTGGYDYVVYATDQDLD